MVAQERTFLTNRVRSEKIASLPPTVASTWLIALRTAMVSVGLLSSSIAAYTTPADSIEDTQALFAVFACLFFANAVLGLWAKYVTATERFVLVQLGFDCLLVSGVVLVTGGAASPFVFLYLLLQMIAAIFLHSGASLLICAHSSALYAAVLISSTGAWGTLPFQAHGAQYPQSRLLLHWIGLTLALGLVQAGTTKIRASLLANLKVAQLSKVTAEGLALQLNQLINGLPEAIIAVDMQGAIRAMNDAAVSLFGPKVSKLSGKSLEELSTFLSEEYGLSRALTDYKAWDELSLSQKDNPEKRLKVILHKKTPDHGPGNFTGTFYLFQNVTELRTIEEKLAMQERMARSLANKGQEQESSPVKLAGFVGESPIMKKLFHLIQRVASSDATILITGESGTGKELVAQAVHLQGNRADGPFIPINCGAIPESLLESELFGHVKGSFTGAIADHIGLFEQAENGTVFLDEVGEMPLAMQAKLLRAIQERVIRPVGAEEARSINVRIVAATNLDLKAAVQTGAFREDLYYRLNVIHMQLPPLRDRKDDIPILIESIVKRLTQDSDVPMIPAQTLEHLMVYNYPGNVRELENILERAMVVGGDVIIPENLPDIVRFASKHPNNGIIPTEIIIRDDIMLPVQLDTMLETIEQHYLQIALEQSEGIKKEAAQLLGMNFRSFRYRLQKFGM